MPSQHVSWEDDGHHLEDTPMTDPTTPNHDEPAEGPRDDHFSAPGGAETGSDPGAAPSSGWGSPGASSTASNAATSILESLRDAIDDLAERAGPTVKEYSVKAAELAATAADKTAPLARKAGEATADASSKLADRSRSWAAGVRESIGTAGASGSATATAEPEAPQDETAAS
jgi:hypothetical protein